MARAIVRTFGNGDRLTYCSEHILERLYSPDDKRCYSCVYCVKGKQATCKRGHTLGKVNDWWCFIASADYPESERG